MSGKETLIRIFPANSGLRVGCWQANNALKKDWKIFIFGKSKNRLAKTTITRIKIVFGTQ